MAKAPTWKTADLKRAISTTQAARLTISAVEVWSALFEVIHLDRKSVV